MRILRFQDTNVKFPRACVCCLGAAQREHHLERSFLRLPQSQIIQVSVPMCHQHKEDTLLRSRAQRIGEITALVIGAAAGVRFAWQMTAAPDGGLLSGLLVGASIFLLIWGAIHTWFVPLLAPPAAKTARAAVRILGFDQAAGVLTLGFANATIAELTLRQNIATLVREPGQERVFEISAQLLDHDIRLNSAISTRVLLDHRPTVGEVEALLQPEIERLMVQQGGVGTFYELNSIQVNDPAPDTSRASRTLKRS
jgi:hypothetical protein